MKASRKPCAKMRFFLVAIALTAMCSATVTGQIIQSIEGDRVQLSVGTNESNLDLALSAQFFVTESSAFSVSVVPAMLDIVHRQLGDNPTTMYRSEPREIAQLGYRLYPFLGDPRRLFGGISGGVQMSVGAAYAYAERDPDPISRTVLGGSLAGSVGVSTNLFGWLFLELTLGSAVTLRRVTEVTGTEFDGKVGDSAVGIVPVSGIKIGVSF